MCLELKEHIYRIAQSGLHQLITGFSHGLTKDIRMLVTLISQAFSHTGFLQVQLLKGPYYLVYREIKIKSISLLNKYKQKLKTFPKSKDKHTVVNP